MSELNQNNEILFCVNEIHKLCKTAIEENRIPHLHDYFTIFWIKKGEAVHATNFIEYVVKENSIFFVPAGLMHKMVLGENCVGLSILFNIKFFHLKHPCDDSILRSTLFSNPDFYTIIKPDKKEIKNFDFIFSSMIHENEANESYKFEILANLLMMLLYESKRIHDRQYQLSEQAIEENPQRLIIRFKQLIEEHYKSAKDVSFYADKLSIRAILLNDHVKKITGITAGEYIRNKIIEETKKILYTSDLNTKEIGFLLGFDDPAYFSRFFKKYTNATLSEYRGLIRKKYNRNEN